MSVYYYLRVVMTMYFRPAHHPPEPIQSNTMQWALALSVIGVGIGIAVSGGDGGDVPPSRLTFAPVIQLDTDAEVIPVKICDVNLDGKPDVLAGTRRDSLGTQSLTVFQNTSPPGAPTRP